MTPSRSLARNILRPAYPDHVEKILELLPSGGHGDFDLQCIKITCGLIGLRHLRGDSALDQPDVVLGQPSAPRGRGDVAIDAADRSQKEFMDHLRLVYRDHPKFLHFLLRFHGVAPSTFSVAGATNG